MKSETSAHFSREETRRSAASVGRLRMLCALTLAALLLAPTAYARRPEMAADKATPASKWTKHVADNARMLSVFPLWHSVRSWDHETARKEWLKDKPKLSKLLKKNPDSPYADDVAMLIACGAASWERDDDGAAEALKRIIDRSGTQFDPRFVDVLEKVMSDEDDGSFKESGRTEHFETSRCRHYLNLGHLYIAIHETDWALRSYMKAEKIAVEMNDSGLQLGAMSGQVMVHCDRRQLEMARETLQRAQRTAGYRANGGDRPGLERLVVLHTDGRSIAAGTACEVSGLALFEGGLATPDDHVAARDAEHRALAVRAAPGRRSAHDKHRHHHENGRSSVVTRGEHGAGLPVARVTPSA